jgi:ribosomal protein S19
MSRAKWKGPYVSNKLLFACNHNKTKKYQEEIFTMSRTSTIIPNLVGFTLQVHNGKNFAKIKITENMIGRKLGEFSPTRKKFSFKKKKIK